MKNNKLFIESLDELSLGDYEELLGEEIRPELVIGMDFDTTVRCRDGVWRPFQNAHSCGQRQRETTESHGDELDHEAYLEI